MPDGTFSTSGLAEVETRMSHLLGQGSAADLARAHLGRGGSRVRARLALAAGASLELGDAAAVACSCAVELLHNGSLVHDDLQDRDPVRRGYPAVWKSDGDAVALMVGDLFISAAYAAAAGLGERAAPAVAAMHEAVAQTIAGQTRDLDCSGAQSFPAYRSVAGAKSGPLLALPIELPLIVAGAEDRRPAARRAARRLALAYQIADDIADRDVDAGADAPNACLALEVADRTPDAARDLATRYAIEALHDTRRYALDLPAPLIAVMGAVAETVESRLRVTCDAA